MVLLTIRRSVLLEKKYLTTLNIHSIFLAKAWTACSFLLFYLVKSGLTFAQSVFGGFWGFLSKKSNYCKMSLNMSTVKFYPCEK